MINGRINNIKINKGDKSLSVSLAIYDIPQVHEGDIVDWTRRCHERSEVTFQPNSTGYIELAEHLASGALTYNLEQARIICNWIHDNIRDPSDDIDWATVFLEIIDHADVE